MDDRKNQIDKTFKIVVETMFDKSIKTEYDTLMASNKITQALIDLYEAGRTEGILQKIITV